MLVAVTESCLRACAPGAGDDLPRGDFGLRRLHSIRGGMLSQCTGNPLAPAWYMIGAVVVGLVAIARMPGIAPVKQGTAKQEPEGDFFGADAVRGRL